MGKRTNTAVWLEKYNRWQIKVQKDGERRTFTSSTPGRNGQREANRKADEWLDEGIDGGSRRVEQLYDEYIAYLKETASKSNWRPAESKGKAWIKPFIGKKKIAALTEHDLQQIVDKAHVQKKSRKTLMNIRATIVNFLKFCKRKRFPVPALDEITIPESARYKEKVIVQPDGLKTLFSVDTTIFRGKRQFDDYIYAYRFQILTGLRPGEMLGLRWGDIEEDYVYIKRAVNAYGEETKGKNNNAIRRFKLTEKAKETIENQRKISCSTDLTDSIFPITQTANYLKRWQKYCEANNIPKTSVYELRHTFVSLAKNLSAGQVKSLVGHSVNMDTFGVYSHEVSGDAERITVELEKVFETFLPDDSQENIHTDEEHKK